MTKNEIQLIREVRERKEDSITLIPQVVDNGLHTTKQEGIGGELERKTNPPLSPRLTELKEMLSEKYQRETAEQTVSSGQKKVFTVTIPIEKEIEFIEAVREIAKKSDEGGNQR